MNVGELVEKLKDVDPELPVIVGTICSCYGTTKAEDVMVESISKYEAIEFDLTENQMVVKIE